MPFIGAVSGLGLIGMINMTSIIIGVSLVAVLAAWYIFYVRKKATQVLTKPSPPHVEPTLRSPKIIYPVHTDEKECSLHEDLLYSFRSTKLVILGFQKVTDQISTEQAKENIDPDTQEKLENLSQRAMDMNVKAETEVLFCESYQQGVNQFLDENKIRMVLTPSTQRDIQRIIVLLYDENQIHKSLTTILQELRSQRIFTIELLVFEDEKENKLKDKLIHQLSIAGIEHEVNISKMEDQLKVNILRDRCKENDLLLLAEEPPSKKQESEYLFYRLWKEIGNSILLLINEEKEDRNV